VKAIRQLFVVLTEQFFDFLGRLGRLAFYIPQLSINKYDVFIDFYTFSKTTSAFPNITMDIQRLN
jgi:hypothetical protein